MAGEREYGVLELDGPRLTAITAVVSTGRVEVKRWLSAVRPETVAGDDAAAVGEWIGLEFKRAGLARGRIVVAVSRGDIVLKQLSVPQGTGPGALPASDAEVAGVVRLQMSRQLPMSAEGSAIDYAPMAGASADGTGARWVMAGAMPAARVAWLRAVARAAGLTVDRIGLRSLGAATLLAELSQRRAGPVLGVAVGSGSTEFVIVEDGQMIFARATDAARPVARAEMEAFADRVAIEAKRTWTSHRASRSSGEIEVVGVLGEGELSRLVGERCGRALERSVEAVGAPSIVELPSHMPEGDRAAALPLVGMLVERAVGRATLDFANPRRLPDAGARRRQFALAGVFALIVLGGLSFVAKDRALGRLRAERDALVAKESELRKSVDVMLVEDARANHLERWAATRVDWLAHVRRLSDFLPEPSLATLDEMEGRLTAATTYTPRGRSYPDGAWGVREQADFQLAGKVRTRQVAADLRQTLLESGAYRVENRGPDTPDRFSLELTTLPPPIVQKPVKPAAAAPPSGGAR